MIADSATHIGIGILIGLAAGFLLGLYTAAYHRDKDSVLIAQKAAAVGVGTAWLVIHGYLLLTGVGTFNVFWDAIGSAAVGELIGINLVQILRSFKGGGNK